MFVCVFATVILELPHSGDDVRAGREVQVEPIRLDQGEVRYVLSLPARYRGNRVVVCSFVCFCIVGRTC